MKAKGLFGIAPIRYDMPITPTAHAFHSDQFNLLFCLEVFRIKNEAVVGGGTVLYFPACILMLYLISVCIMKTDDETCW